MDNKMKIISLCCLFSISAIIISGIISVNETRKEENENRVYIVNSSMENIKIDENVGEESSYLVKADNGKLAVFSPVDDKIPIKTTDIYIESLRQYDQDLLKQGITVYGDKALSMILEDYGN